MKVKINKKNYQIKPASEMTVKEYVSLFSMLKEDSRSIDVLICYLSATTGLKYNNVADIDLNENSIRRLYSYIGEIVQVGDIQLSKQFYHKKTGKTIYQKNLNWRTLGARKLLEDRIYKHSVTTNKVDEEATKAAYKIPLPGDESEQRIVYKKITENYTQIEQAVYLLAVYLSDDYDNDKIEEIYIELQDYNAIEVLSFIIFFFRKLLNGKKSGKNFFQRLSRKVNINILKRSSK